LPDIIRQFQEASPGTSLQVLTGGVFKKRLLQTISPRQVGLIFNINEPRDYRNPKHFAKVMGNVEESIRLGFKVMVGFNVWRMDFDAGFIPTLSYNLGRAGFRWAVANPQLNLYSNVIDPSRFASLAPRCLEMLQKAAALNLEAELDCPLPLCFFTEKDLAWLRQFHPKTASRMGLCDPVLDVTPELEAIRCFALSRLDRVKVTDFPNEWSILEWFRENVDSCLMSAGCFDHCGACQHFTSGRCNGGCLAWHRYGPDTSILTDPYQLANAMRREVEEGCPEKALQYYEAAGHRARKDLPAFIAAVAAFRLGRKEAAFRYAARATDLARDPGLRQQAIELLKTITPDEGSVLNPPVIPEGTTNVVTLQQMTGQDPD